MRRVSVILACAALSACAGGSKLILVPTTPSARTAPAPVTPVREAVRTPELSRERGTESIVGQRASALLARFGKPRIDLVEGDARKLQYGGASCVLDIYLYPLQAGGEPVATHVEARLRKGGAGVDKARCLAEISRR
ncbi:hypothetical protein ACI5KX_01435 [Erythrobacter sp. GH1-10]|uniref:hypothetical protein n=1 Tax=Erythrobacter sp. GH1-10 TaxID=3349334 RepID=UPI003877DD82